MFTTAILALLALSSPTTTAPTPRALNTLRASSLTAISPATASCSNAPAAGECRTATQAAPHILASFHRFGVTHFATQAALISLMLYESGDFKYNKNHFPAPGVAGQGTRNMQTPENNLAYANWIAASGGDATITTATVQQAEQAGPAAVLALVDGDEWGFGSAAWYLATQCAPGTREELASGTVEGWEAYLTGCVGTTATDDRNEIWRKALALGAW